MIRRRLHVNWSEAHSLLKQAWEQEVREPALIPPMGKGWSYLTFCPLGTRSSGFLFDVEKIRILAREHDFFLPRDILLQHSKVVVTAHAEDGHQSTSLFGLYSLIDLYCRKFVDAGKHPRRDFYGKFGGVYERPEKGRVWAIYTTDEDALLEIYESIEGMKGEVGVSGVQFETSFSNGLSAIPRLLHGFGDPGYRQSGANHYRISDVNRFHVLLDQALVDHTRYLFDN